MKNLRSDRVLDDIIAHKQQEIAQRKQLRPLASLQPKALLAGGMPLEKAFRNNRTTIPAILEIKPASPSAGILTEALNLPALLDVYQRYGVAFSVLTDQKYFGGSIALMQEVVETVQQPVLCKDFIIDD